MSNKRPLFEAYPLLEQKLPFVALGELPTPVQALPELGPGFARNAAYIKRDDLSGEYGGNKVRKLEFVLADAMQKGVKEVLTFGASGSNHAIATAIYAKRLGMHSISLLLDQPNAAYVRHNLKKELAFGAELHYFVDRADQEADVNVELETHCREYGREPYIVPLGGSCPLGNIGFVNAAFELKRQVDAGELPEPDYIYMPCGTMGSAIGLIIGLKALGMKTKVVAVRVNRAGYVNPDNVLAGLWACYGVIKSAAPSFPDLVFSAEDFLMEEQFFGEAYAHFTQDGYEAIKTCYQGTGILLDGTYTGKAFAAFLHHINTRYDGKVCLFWNTLNSKDFTAIEDSVDYHELPEEFHKYFQMEDQAFDFQP
jgi:1-aminocyclopropane-1-carboxylate deaminase/D-cysteine desulfhydrase-like pyridoxal-dependent ACC family enzyme